MTIVNWIGFFLATVLALGAAGHALLHKSNSRSALGWVGVCLTFPLAGPLLYILFGVNRVRRSASRMREEVNALAEQIPDMDVPTRDAEVRCEQLAPHLRPLERVGRSVLGRNLLGGNCVDPLFNGDEAYPAILRALDGARRSIYLATYILSTDALGRQLIAALERAVRRGVDVRVLVDGLGEKYSWPRASRLLAKADVPVALFLPPHLFPPELHVNLRNHRKILVVDGELGFTGGMNISEQHLLGARPFRPVTDLHVVLRGPIVAHLQEAFVEDWFFATKEHLAPPVPDTAPVGDCLCRAVLDGPDQGGERLESLLTAVVSAASRSVKIMTPYFLPPRTFLIALESARHRGVDVRIILPARNNIPFVQWAVTHTLNGLLDAGITVAYQPSPFCHTKLLLVDETYVHLGSANLDSRSLRLNFELTLEVLDTVLARRLHHHFDAVMAKSRVISSAELMARSLPSRMRDAFFWLFSPYL